MSLGKKEWIWRSEEEMGAMDGIYVYLFNAQVKIRFTWSFSLEVKETKEIVHILNF